ncbi:MAG: type I methionyl aminopeptidase [Myxococcota bacterium]
MITIKTDAEIEKMRLAGALAAKTLQSALSLLKPGISTKEIDQHIYRYIVKNGAIPAPLNYRGYPASSCISVNEVICHGIPSKKVILKEGDIVGIDVTVILDGYYGDTTATTPVGAISPHAHTLLYVTQQALMRGIAAVKEGNRLGDIGFAIQSYVEPFGYSVVRDFVGHGIGREFHEQPQVPHHGEAGKGLILKSGMTFTIEPMINAGRCETRILQDGWTAVTADGKLSAQFEHTLLCTPEGAEILTRLADSESLSPGGYDVPPPNELKD